MAKRNRRGGALKTVFVDADEYAKRSESRVGSIHSVSGPPPDLLNLPIDPAEVASHEHNEALKMREAGASAVPVPTRLQ